MRVGWIIIFIFSLALCSCDSRNPSAHTSEASSGDHQPDVSRKRAEAAGIIVLNPTQQQRGHVLAEPVRAKEVAATLTIPGRLTVSEDQTWQVGAIASGRIEGISARVGDSVGASQILGRIHSHEVHEARAAYQEALTELRRSQTAESFAQERSDRARRLLELRAGSRQDFESAEADLRNAQAAIQKAQSEVEKERSHMQIFQVPLEEPAADGAQNGEADDIPILAPASGVILERKATVGSVVNSGDELFVITDTSKLWMIGAANEEDLSKLREGQPARIEVRAYEGRIFSGHILKLGEKLDPETRTLQVRILVPNVQGLLKPEMYATALLQQTSRHSGLFVSEEAVQEIGGESVVFVRRGQSDFEARTVKRGQDLDGETEILEGLNAGEVVVVKGSFLLKSQMLKSTIQDN